MKLETAKLNGLNTNAVTESQDFKIGNPEMIIEILRNKLYANPIRTLVQEYLSNARDAQREAGSKTPTRVSLPTSDDPVIKIRDFGPGLSPERVREIFTSYGDSTKRNSNSQTGGFGIGAKSAWAYTDSFTVISYHGGKAYHYVAHVSKKTTGSLDLISETATTEPNGTEIHIAVKEGDLREFDVAVQRAVAFWKKSEFPTTDGYISPVKTFLSFASGALTERDSVSGFIHLGDKWGSARPIICVDGIPYPMPEDFERKVSKLMESVHNKVVSVLFFKTGEIEVSASREAISNSEANGKVIGERAADTLKAIREHVAKQLNGAGTLQEFLETHRELGAWFHFDRQRAEFKDGADVFAVSPDGELTLPERFAHIQFTQYSLTGSSRSRYYSDGSDRVRADSTSRVKYPLPGRAFWGNDETSHANQNRRFKSYLQSNSVNSAYLIYTPDVADKALSELAAKLGLQPTSDLGPASVRKTLKKDSSTDVVINVYQRETSRQTTGKVVNLERNQTQYVYVVRKSEDANGENKPLAALVSACGLEFCLVAASNESKIKGNPNFLSEAEFFKGIDSALAKNPEASEKFLNGLIREIFRNFGGSVPKELIPCAPRIKDPVIRDGLKALKRVKKISDYYSRGEDLNTSGLRTQALKNSPSLSKFYREVKALKKSLESNYKLVTGAGWSGRHETAELTFYINAKYAAAVKGAK